MRQTLLTGAALLCGLTLLFGCRTDVPARPEEQLEPATRDTATNDALVLQVVFDDMLSADNDESPGEWNRNQSKPVYIATSFHPQLKVSDVLAERDKKKWKSLTKSQSSAAIEAAEDLIVRVEKEEPLPELRSTSGRIQSAGRAGPATQRTREDPFPERSSAVCLPGYSRNGRYAVVHLWFPWSIHSGEATYILERTDRGWKVLLREFTYYV